MSSPRSGLKCYGDEPYYIIVIILIVLWYRHGDDGDGLIGSSTSEHSLDKSSPGNITANVDHALYLPTWYDAIPRRRLRFYIVRDGSVGSAAAMSRTSGTGRGRRLRRRIPLPGRLSRRVADYMHGTGTVDAVRNGTRRPETPPPSSRSSWNPVPALCFATRWHVYLEFSVERMDLNVKFFYHRDRYYYNINYYCC